MLTSYHSIVFIFLFLVWTGNVYCAKLPLAESNNESSLQTVDSVFKTPTIQQIMTQVFGREMELLAKNLHKNYYQLDAQMAGFIDFVSTRIPELIPKEMLQLLKQIQSCPEINLQCVLSFDRNVVYDPNIEVESISTPPK